MAVVAGQTRPPSPSPVKAGIRLLWPWLENCDPLLKYYHINTNYNDSKD